MVNVSCNECGEEFILSEYNYAKRKRANKNSNLFCSRKCSGQHKKHVVTTTAQEDLDEWFKASPSNDTIVGVSLTTTNNTIGGEVILNSEESNVMADEHLTWAAEMAKKNPDYLKMSLADIIKAESQEAGVEVSSATPIMPAPTTVVTPAPTTVVAPVQSNVVNPVQSSSVWQQRLDDRTALKACDAKFHDEARTMRMCNPDPETGGRYLYHIVDPIDGLKPTPTKKLCFRCQGKGTMSLRNLGYNWKTDIEYGNINASVSFSAYVASKNTNNLPVVLPADNTLPQYQDGGSRQPGFSAL